LVRRQSDDDAGCIAHKGLNRAFVDPRPAPRHAEARRLVNVNQNRDYPVLTDYRAMFAGLFQRIFGLETASVQRIFAGVHPAELGLV
jgi:hypothetical protein